VYLTVIIRHSQAMNGPSHPLIGGGNAFTLIKPVERSSRLI